MRLDPANKRRDAFGTRRVTAVQAQKDIST